jgi:hypothetical protein
LLRGDTHTDAIINASQNVEAGICEMMWLELALTQLSEDVAVKIGVTFPRLCRNEVSIDDALFVHPCRTCLFDFKADITIAGELAAEGDPCGDQDLDAMADGEYPFAL